MKRSFINLTDCVIWFQEFVFKRIFNESAVRDSQFLVSSSSMSHQSCSLTHSVGIWPPRLNTFSNIRFPFSYIPAWFVYMFVSVDQNIYIYIYVICRECYVLKWCLCVCSLFLLHTFLFFLSSLSLFLSMWSVWWLLYINYLWIE